MAHVLVVGDIDLPPPLILAPYTKGARLVVAADGGANRAERAGIPVDWIVGDLDGVHPRVLAKIPPARVVHDEGRDSTDLEKVMTFLATRRTRRVVLTGVTGGRLDHTLGALAILARWSRRFELEIVDKHFVTTAVNRSSTFRAPVGTMVSLISPQGAHGVTTRGLRYELRDARLPFSPLGIHNEVTRSPARVAVGSGVVFLMRSHRVAPHA